MSDDLPQEFPLVCYRLEIADLNAHLYRVTLTVPQPAARQRLSLPVWIPGSYLVREFARNLQSMRAWQGRREVPLQPLDKCSWLAECSGGSALTVTYLVYALDASVRTAWLDAHRGFVNGTSVFLAVEGAQERPHRVELGPLPAGWDVATGLSAVPAGEVDAPDGSDPEVRTRSRQAVTHAWEAPDYDALIDHPIEMGAFWRGTFEACGVPHEFVVAGALPGFDGERLLADTKKICEAQIRFWHGDNKPPFDRYVFMLNAVQDGYGGLEHRNSTALICQRKDLPRTVVRTDGEGPMAGAPAESSDGYITLLGLISHEYFHTWNVKRLKPAEFVPYDLTRENHTELLWFFEGFTSYYDDLFLLRAGLIDEVRYLKLVAKTMNQVLGTPGRKVQSVAQASWDAWTKYYRPDENTANATVSYYTKGALVALALDLTLRGEGQGTLDGVMHHLWRHAVRPLGHGGDAPRAITGSDVAAALLAVGGRAYTDELGRWVHGLEDLPLEALWGGLGVTARREPAPLAQRLGARVSDRLKVQSVLRAGAAEQAGLAAGDELVAVDDWRLQQVDDLLLYGAAHRSTRLLICRDGRMLTLLLPVLSGGEGPVQLEWSEPASAEVKRLRQAWRGGGA